MDRGVVSSGVLFTRGFSEWSTDVCFSGLPFNSRLEREKAAQRKCGAALPLVAAAALHSLGLHQMLAGVFAAQNADAEILDFLANPAVPGLCLFRSLWISQA